MPSRNRTANLAAVLCTFLVLGGSAYAATSIGSKEVHNGSLASLQAQGLKRAGSGEVVISRRPDSSSPVLSRRTVTGEPIPGLSIQLDAPGAHATYNFRNVIVKSLGVHGSGAERTEEVVLHSQL